MVWKSSIRRLSFFVVLACFLMGSFSARAQDAQPQLHLPLRVGLAFLPSNGDARIGPDAGQVCQSLMVV